MSRRKISFDTRPSIQRPDLRPRVALFDPDGWRRARWAELVGGGCVVTSYDSLPALEEALGDAGFDVVVAGWHSELWRLLEGRGWPSQYLHVGLALPDLLIDGAEQSLPVASLGNELQLEEKIRQMTKAHRARALRHLLSGLTISLPGSEERLGVLDVSNFGLAFELSPWRDLEPFLPGALLRGCTVKRDAEVALENVSLRVRYLSFDIDRFRVGCEFPTVDVDRSDARASYVTDRAAIASLVNMALTGSGLVVEQMSGQQLLAGARGKIEAGGAVARLDAERDDLDALELVQCRFEASGSVYRFTTSVSGARPLRLHLPSFLEERHRRSSSRERLKGTQVQVTVHSRLAEAPLKANVIDLSASGVSFAINHGAHLLPVGLRLDSVELDLGPGGRIRCGGRVRNLSGSVGEGAGRCGVELTELEQADRLKLAEYVVRQRLPGAEDGARVPFRDLWSLFCEGGLIPPERQALLAPMLPRIAKTFEGMGSKPNDVFRSVVVHENGELVGHVSANRVYRRTWFVQHLATRGVGSQSYVLNMAAAEYFGQLSDLEYFTITFLADNKWPAQVFGGFGRRLRDPESSDIRGIYALTVPAGWKVPPELEAEVRELEVRWATPDDLVEIQAYYVRTEVPLLVRANDLTVGAMSLADIDGRFRELGLTRTRRFLVALNNGRRVAFAPLELSSMGIHLYEFFSAFEIHFLEPPSARLAPVVRARLLEEATKTYAEDGRVFARGFIRRADIPAYEALGLQASARIISWTCHRGQFRKFTDHVERLFRSLLARNRRRTAKG